jgi:membrane-associated phospholipid phosphatase
LPLIKEFARDTPWLHPVVIGYAEYAIVVFRRAAGGRVVDRAAPGRPDRAGGGGMDAAGLWQPSRSTSRSSPHSIGRAPMRFCRTFWVLVQRGSDPSFPSDYAVLAGAVASGLWLVSGRLGAVAAVAAAVMAFAGVYIGALYTHDALAGLAVGNAVSVIGFWATRPVLVRLLRRAEDTRLVRPLLTVGDTAEWSSR